MQVVERVGNSLGSRRSGTLPDTFHLPLDGDPRRMPLDPYSPCPGGTGKKLKFCCAELVGDLEQIDRLTEGQQYAAALDLAERLARQHPGRACLLASRTRLQLATKKFTEAAAGSREFVEAFPDNPVALGQAAVMEGIGGRVQE
jgi:hypothetical protein